MDTITHYNTPAKRRMQGQRENFVEKRQENPLESQANVQINKNVKMTNIAV